MGRLGGVRPAAPARVATALDLTTRSRGEVSDTFEGLAHRAGARETLGQRGTCNGAGTRRARMGKASQSTGDVLYTQGLKLDRISACASARRIASEEKEPRLAKTLVHMYNSACL